MRRELPLRNLHERHRALTVPIAGTYEEAASVCLQRHHTTPTDVILADNGSRSEASVNWISPDQRTRDAWANETDATRDGAYGCVIAGVEVLRGVYAVRRAETGTGADYYIGPPGSGVNDLEECFGWRSQVLTTATRKRCSSGSVPRCARHALAIAACQPSRASSDSGPSC